MHKKKNDPTSSFTNILVIEIERVHDLTVINWCQRLSDAGESKLGYELIRWTKVGLPLTSFTKRFGSQ